VAVKNGWTSIPQKDRWESRPTAMYGGVAIFGAFVAGATVLEIRPGYHAQYDVLGLAVGGALIFAVGLWDDIHALNPLVKLCGQMFAITPFLVGGLLTYRPPDANEFIFGLPITLFWMLALTNAFNLLDNMDGLCAGAAAIVAVSLAGCAFFGTPPAPLAATLMCLVAACALGFLVFNFRRKGRALIFMGDCGSMFLGYMLAGLTIVGVFRCAPDRLTAAAVPLLIMSLPIFDTTLVIIMRKREKRSISQGGRDHSSHRLVYAGLSDKRAVVALLAVCAVNGALAVLLMALPQPALAVLAVLVVTAVMAGLGAYLGRQSEPEPDPEEEELMRLNRVMAQHPTNGDVKHESHARGARR
ncbi:MAG TPA: MraY family glycosyltransferase, partial [Chthonomonadales bacterium]|nr:MraY family glycosyltransferase [Chthonomonadales bacterium]